jgi:hypothetical protein
MDSFHREAHYKDLDVTIRPDKMIRNQGQVTLVAGVSLFPAAKAVHLRETDEHGKVIKESNQDVTVYVGRPERVHSHEQSSDCHAQENCDPHSAA